MNIVLFTLFDHMASRQDKMSKLESSAIEARFDSFDDRFRNDETKFVRCVKWVDANSLFGGQ